MLISNAQSSVAPDDNMKLNLGIFDDEIGILRCRGRLAKCDGLQDDCKYPIYMPPHAPITGLILKRIHWMMHHCGQGILVTEFRKKILDSSVEKTHTQERSHLLLRRSPRSHPTESTLADHSSTVESIFSVHISLRQLTKSPTDLYLAA